MMPATAVKRRESRPVDGLLLLRVGIEQAEVDARHAEVARQIDIGQRRIGKPRILDLEAQQLAQRAEQLRAEALMA